MIIIAIQSFSTCIKSLNKGIVVIVTFCMQESTSNGKESKVIKILEVFGCTFRDKVNSLSHLKVNCACGIVIFYLAGIEFDTLWLLKLPKCYSLNRKVMKNNLSFSKEESLTHPRSPGAAVILDPSIG